MRVASFVYSTDRFTRVHIYKLDYFFPSTTSVFFDIVYFPLFFPYFSILGKSITQRVRHRVNFVFDATTSVFFGIKN